MLEDNHSVEEGEHHNGDEQEHPVAKVAGVKHPLYPLGAAGDDIIAGGGEDTPNVRREDDDGEGEDKWDHAHGVHPQGDMRLTRLAIHTAATENAARILDRDLPLPLLDDNDQVNQADHQSAY